MKAVIFTHVLYLILMKGHMAKGVAKCESKVELRAVMLSCPVKDSGCDDDDPLSQVMKSEESQILQADSSNFEALRMEKERGFPNEVKDCKRKLVITLKVKNVGKIPCDDEYIVVDHVFDPVTGGRGRLLSPVVVKLRQEQMVQLYGLQFQRVVNSDPFEEQRAVDKTCSVDPENPTCGIATYDGKPIPFSEGFCCSCDPHVNAKRQSSPVSRGDSILYRDSKLIYQGNARSARKEKPRAIVDPDLVKLKSGNSDDASGDNKSSDCGGISDPMCWERVPNYLMEKDRKIVCDRGDFMKELCRLRDERIEELPISTKNYKNVETSSETSDFKKFVNKSSESPKLVSTTASPKANRTNDSRGNSVLPLKNLLEELNSIRTSGSVAFSEGFDPANGSRGKRENRESRKLSLEERLNRFASLKKPLTSRKKRLLELSHKRFRKTDERCMEGRESQKSSQQEYSLTEYVKSPPPRFFFSHDRAIIDPLEPASEVANSSCRALTKNDEFADGAKDKMCRPHEKSGSFRCFNEEGKDKTMDQLSRRRQSKGEIKSTRKDKYLVGKMVGKKEKVSHLGVGGEESGVGAGRESTIESGKTLLKELSGPKGGRRFNSYAEAERAEDAEERAKMNGNDQKNQQNVKNLRILLHKNDSEKKFLKPKIKNIFMSKNREKQKFVKGHKKAEFGYKEDFGGAFKERLKVEDDAFQRKKVEGSERGVKKFENHEEVFEKHEIPDLNQCGKERPETDLTSLNNEVLAERNYPKEPPKKTLQSNRIRHPDESVDTNVNFNVEIIRNRIPETSKHRHHSTFVEKSGKSRTDGSFVEMRTNIYGKNGESQVHKPHHSPSQKYYISSNDDGFAQNMFPMEKKDIISRPRLKAISFDPVKVMDRAKLNHDTYPPYRKGNRRYYPSAAELGGTDENVEKQRSFTSSRGDAPPLGLPRGKRYSDSTRKHREKNEKMGFRSEWNEGLQQARNKRRSKRSASYTFQPARGFYGSELDFRKPDGHFCRELVTCPTEESSTKRSSDAWRFSRSKHENLSVESQELQDGLGRRTVSSSERVNGERIARSISDKQRLIQSYLNAPDYILEEVKESLKGKKQTGEPKKADNLREGATIEKDAYERGQDTAHCMRFGDLWYSLYMIKQPVVSQVVGLQLFDKHSLYDGSTEWRDLTKGKMIRVGTFLQKAEDDLPTMSLTFMGEKAKKVESPIDPDNYYLLIPSHVSDPSKVNSYPQFEGGPAEYLLVHSKDVSSGGECNMIGTSFEAFARQPERCSQRRGSCLKRQPVDLWREDMEARIRGKKGKYFVENFGNVPNSPIKTYTNLTGEYLALEYYGEYTSTIEIEVKADSNAIIRKGSNAQIPLVYIDSTYPKKTRIILSVLNVGLTSSYFRPRLGDCPPDLDPSWCPLEGPLVTIPPQQRHDFKLDLSGTLPSKQIHLTVQVLNQVNKQIAHRKIIIKRRDRCVCAFHCKCNCIGNLVGGRTCRRLNLEEYRKAGYIGSYPFRGGAAASAPESLLRNIHIVFLTASYVLLFLGVMKGVFGIFVRRIGIAGTRIITGPRELCCYYECELMGCSVLYDECGFPVHPTTCQPVQIVPLWLEIIINFFFFFLYPLRGIWFLLLSLPCCRLFCCEMDGYCRQEEGDSDHKSSCPLLMKQPKPTCVHYNLTTIDSRKSKQEYLPYPAYSGDDDPLEEDDTEFVLQEMKRYRKK